MWTICATNAATVRVFVRMQALLIEISLHYLQMKPIASTNDGFVVLDETKVKIRFLGTITDQVPFGIQRLIDAVKNDYSYLLMKNS